MGRLRRGEGGKGGGGGRGGRGEGGGRGRKGGEEGGGGERGDEGVGGAVLDLENAVAPGSDRVGEALSPKSDAGERSRIEIRLDFERQDFVK